MGRRSTWYESACTSNLRRRACPSSCASIVRRRHSSTRPGSLSAVSGAPRDGTVRGRMFSGRGASDTALRLPVNLDRGILARFPFLILGRGHLKCGWGWRDCGLRPCLGEDQGYAAEQPSNRLPGPSFTAHKFHCSFPISMADCSRSLRELSPSLNVYGPFESFHPCVSSLQAARRSSGISI
jgi:hypothetical protein